MQGDVTRRFLHGYQLLRQNGTIKSGRQFALSLEYLPQSWNEILQGRRDMPLDLLHKAAVEYHVNPNFLFSGEGDPFFEDHMNEKVRLRTIVVNEKAQERIVLVPISALGNYPAKHQSTDFIEALTFFTLPEYHNSVGTHRCFEVSGDQMEPSLFDGERVIGSYLHPDRWQNGLRDNHCFVIVTKTQVFVRRVLNKLEDSQSLILIADNNYYPPVRVMQTEIQEIWLIIQKISPFLHGQAYQEDALKEQIAMLYDQMMEQNRLIKALVGL
jgi:Peptidase S24-like